MIDATYAELRRRGGMGGRPLAAGNVGPGPCRAARRVRAGDAVGVDLGQPGRTSPPDRDVTPELRPPTPAELRILLDHVAERDPQLHALLVLAAFTGARRAQLLGLRWHNVHLAARRVSFSAGWVEGPDGPVLTATKTKRRHVVDLDPATFDVLVDLAAERGCDARATRSCSATTAARRRGNRTGSPKRSSGIAVQPGLRPFRLHDLRHFMATEMLHAGVPLVIVSRRLDHRRVRPRSTSTPTPSPAATLKPPPPSQDHADHSVTTNPAPSRATPPQASVDLSRLSLSVPRSMSGQLADHEDG